ncbi:hypothetical protein FB451DRAFT_1183964 [Mycena latifolia]|nr:hypothetical protein FB451DRAFT_1183964 [Mycena latifolia]
MTILAGHIYHPVPNDQHLVEQALEYITYFDDPDLKCRFYDRLATFYHFPNNDIPKAIYFAETGLALAISTENIQKQSLLWATLGAIKWAIGDYSDGWKHASEAQRLAKISGHLFNEAAALQTEAMCFYGLGRYNHSIFLFNRARDLLSLCEKRPFQHLLNLVSIAQIDVEMEEVKHEVYQTLDTANQLASSLGYSTISTWCDIIPTALLVKEGDVSGARSLFRTYLTSTWGKDSSSVSYCLEKLGDVRLRTPSDNASYNSAVTFLVHSIKLKKRLEIHKALQLLANVYLAGDDYQTATSLFTVALEGFTEMDVHRSRAECMLHLGDISKVHGDVVNAGGLWETARPLFERASQAKQVRHIDKRLAGISDKIRALNVLVDLNAPATWPAKLDSQPTSMTQPPGMMCSASVTFSVSHHALNRLQVELWSWQVKLGFAFSEAPHKAHFGIIGLEGIQSVATEHRSSIADLLSRELSVWALDKEGMHSRASVRNDT